MAKPFLSVIIPAYNEAKRLPKTLLDMDKYLTQAGFSYEIIVVNDGSKDHTAEIVTKMREFIKNLYLIDNKDNQGKGGVVAQGMLAAKGTLRLFSDADNSTSLDQVEKFFPYFKQGYDVVIGSRYVKDSELPVKQPFFRQLPGRIGNFLIRLLAVPGIIDTQCGFKAFKSDVARIIFPKLAYFSDRLDQSGWTVSAYDVEFLFMAQFLCYKIKDSGN